MMKITYLGAVAAAIGACSAALVPLQARGSCSFEWTASAGDTCTSIANDWGISKTQFQLWNVVDCSKPLQAGKEYCLLWTGDNPPGAGQTTGPSPTSTTAKPTSTTTSTRASSTTAPTDGPVTPSPTQDGIASGCQKYHKAVSGDTCQGIVNKYGGLTLQQFYAWNPAVGTSCASLWLDYYYCVGVSGTPTGPTTTSTSKSAQPSPTSNAPGPVQDGIASDCQRYHLVKSGDGCQKIVDQYKSFTLQQFYSWNPAVGSSCSGLWLDYYVCIGVSGTTTPGTPQQPSTPSPVQEGINAKCNKYHEVVSGDYCQKIADQYKISLSTFYSWNPAVGTSCSALWLGYHVCVGSA
ncbi:uncharacterized protein B0I36DRAFT_369543 [Microdochium trichocladiopsis]|uniref:LysM domain-containing protein n=1 Tax=Microdochium trichocladiopsis TaxID=1682393 RepID=A0A9P8XSW0_9PEZI|nr:uncharacterized protein B0I36DRAFT_369543 [Microdochium trichocladiopsis]KAH7014605.1 hypothetical protein B0I36DRAFT_369543 [Microdochium trichocladiopsis]